MRTQPFVVLHGNSGQPPPCVCAFSLPRDAPVSTPLPLTHPPILHTPDPSSHPSYTWHTVSKLVSKYLASTRRERRDTPATSPCFYTDTSWLGQMAGGGGGYSWRDEMRILSPSNPAGAHQHTFILENKQKKKNKTEEPEWNQPKYSSSSAVFNSS